MVGSIHGLVVRGSAWGVGVVGGRCADSQMGEVALLRKSLFVSNQTAHLVPPGSHSSNDTHFFRLCLVTCDILITIRIVIGPWVACILSSNPKQILLAKKGRSFRGLSHTIPSPHLEWTSVRTTLDEEEKSERQLVT